MEPGISILAPGMGPVYTHSPSYNSPWSVLILRGALFVPLRRIFRMPKKTKSENSLPFSAFHKHLFEARSLVP